MNTAYPPTEVLIMFGACGSSLIRSFMHQEQARIDATLERTRRRRGRTLQRISADRHLTELEDHLGHTLVLALAVNRLLLRNEILQSGDIARFAREFEANEGDIQDEDV